jgi:hypothetical protein
MRSHHLMLFTPLVAALAGFVACSAPKDGEASSRAQSAAQSDPPGNNGTVKIQEAGATDEIPDNDPHVGCVFTIEYRGFDEGAPNGTWTLSAQPPSGTTTITGPNTVFIGEDAAGGANDLDATVTVRMADYDLSGLYEHPTQGYHLKLEAHADGSQGADTKFKVFWVKGCNPPPPPDAGASSSGGSSSGGSTSSSGGSSSGQTW